MPTHKAPKKTWAKRSTSITRLPPLAGLCRSGQTIEPFIMRIDPSMHLPRVSLLPVLVLLTTCSEPTTDTRPPPNPQTVSVLTQHNDNTRAGWNANETALTTRNVNLPHFGALFSLPVDDHVYAQPLVVGNVAIANPSRNVVYVATVNNTLYAYDGDD